MSTNVNYIFKEPGPATLTKEKILHISFCSLDISTKDDEMDLPFLYLITKFPKRFMKPQQIVDIHFVMIQYCNTSNFRRSEKYM